MKNSKINKESHINVICKTTNRCNANCHYCFDKCMQGVFSPTISQETVLKAFDKFSSGVYDIDGCGHGGEPLLIGYDGLEDTMFKMKRIALKKGVNLKFILQTNGLLMDEKILDLCNRYGVSIGVSYDGITNGRSRGYETTDLSLQGTNGIITVINKHNIDILYQHYLKINRAYKNAVFNFVYGDNVEELLGDETYALNRYSEFILKYIDDVNALPSGGERTANDLIAKSMGKNSYTCIFNNCFFSNIICLNTDGNIYKCDETEYDEIKIGYIDDFDSYEELFEKGKYVELKNIHDAKVMKEPCLSCEYKKRICKGGCFVRTIAENGGVKPQSFYCKLLKKTLPMIYDRLYNLTPEEFVLLNPNVRKILIENNYLPAYIKEYLATEEVNFDAKKNDNIKTFSQM